MQNQGIGPWIHRKKQRCQGQVALSYFDQDTLYEELADRINRFANSLLDLGVRHGDRVAYLGNNHPSFLESLFAVSLIGAIFVPINSRWAAPEVRYALEDSGSGVLIYNDEFAALARESSVHSPVTQLIVAGADTPADARNYEALIDAGSIELPQATVSQDDPAIILYTSGTTGRPKGAVLTHGNITWNSFNVIVDFGVSAGEKVLLISPMFHVASLTNGAITVLLQGGTVVLHDRFDAGQALEAIEEHGITMLSGVPTTFQMIQEHPRWESTDISSLQRLTCGGSAIPERTLEAYEDRGLGFTMGYGMTEAGPGVTALPAHMGRVKPGSSGLQHFFTNSKIVNPQGEEVPTGEVGEIWVSGPNVIREYWNRPEATAEAIVEGWLRSGDVGHFDEDGYIYISDRLKDMIISGGENIYSAEIEALIMEIPEVAAVAIVGMADEKWGEVPHAHVQLHPGTTLEEEDLLAHLDGKIARFKVPKNVTFVDELPRTASGKIQKTKLRTQDRTTSQ